jgi:hypothetical protein
MNIILFLSQGYWCKLDLILASELFFKRSCLPCELCQTVGDEFILYLAYLVRSWQKHKICEIKFGKLLEMLTMTIMKCTVMWSILWQWIKHNLRLRGRTRWNTFTTRNYLICDAFSTTFSENVTNVHCSPKHCDDFFNSSRFYDVFLFFVTDLHRSPKHCDDLLNPSRFYDVFLFSS